MNTLRAVSLREAGCLWGHNPDWAGTPKPLLTTPEHPIFLCLGCEKMFNTVCLGEGLSGTLVVKLLLSHLGLALLNASHSDNQTRLFKFPNLLLLRTSGPRRSSEKSSLRRGASCQESDMLLPVYSSFPFMTGVCHSSQLSCLISSHMDVIMHLKHCCHYSTSPLKHLQWLVKQSRMVVTRGWGLRELGYVV